MSEDGAVVLVDLGGSGGKVSVVRADGSVHTTPVALPVERPGPHRVEWDPARWWAALSAGPPLLRPGEPCRGVVVASLRQGYVLTDGRAELGRGVLNSDRRGAGQLDRLRQVDGLYERTGHWPAPELTLPKLLHTAAEEPAHWAAARRVLFVADWLAWRLTGVEATEVSYACAGMLADVAARTWAKDLLDALGLDPDRLPSTVEAGTPVGALGRPWRGLPAGTAVVAGCGDTQLAAAGVGGLDDGVVTVVAGSSTPVQAATAVPPRDPLRRPWVSTHARADRWAAETNGGYPGTMQGWLARVAGATAPSGRPGAGGVVAVTGAPVWDEAGWATKAPMSVVGIGPDTTAADLAQAFAEAHAFSVRANVEDLERVLGRRAGRVVLAGGWSAHDPAAASRLADVLGREVHAAGPDAAAHAAWQLVTGEPLPLSLGVVAPDRPGTYEEAYRRYRRTWAVLRDHLPDADG